MYSNNYTLGFVFIVTLVLGTMLSFTKDSVKSLQDQNLKADVQKTILRSLNFEENLSYSTQNLHNSLDQEKYPSLENYILEITRHYLYQ